MFGDYKRNGMMWRCDDGVISKKLRHDIRINQFREFNANVQGNISGIE